MKVARSSLVGVLLFVSACQTEHAKFDGKSASYWRGQLKHQNYVARARAANAMAYLGEEGKRSIPDLIQLLEDKEGMVRWASASALARFGADASDALTRLDEMAESERSPPARDAAENTAKIIRQAMKEQSAKP